MKDVEEVLIGEEELFRIEDKAKTDYNTFIIKLRKINEINKNTDWKKYAEVLTKNLANKRNNIREPDILNNYIVTSAIGTAENSKGTTKIVNSIVVKTTKIKEIKQKRKIAKHKYKEVIRTNQILKIKQTLNQYVKLQNVYKDEIIENGKLRLEKMIKRITQAGGLIQRFFVILLGITKGIIWKTYVHSKHLKEKNCTKKKNLKNMLSNIMSPI